MREPIRKLTTILSADVAEFSRMMRIDEDGTFQTLRLCRQAIDPLVGAHQGRIFGTAGDSVVAEFASPVEALRCAADIQQAVEKVDAEVPEQLRMRFRIGINLGDVLVEGADLIGDGVNIADRIQHAASPGEICISATVQGLVKNQPEFSYDDLGEISVKNIAQPVRVYRARRGPAGGLRSRSRSRRTRAILQASGSAALVAAVLVAILALAVHFGYLPLPSWQPQQGREASNVTSASIAVLPFENLSGDATQDYFAQGITEDMTLALGRFSDLAVVAREAVQQYQGKAWKPGELSTNLGVRYALHGTVRRANDRIRVTATLSDAMSGVQLWSDRYDGEVKDVFAVMDDITQQVVGALAIKISDIERQRSLAKRPEDLRAYDYLQRGREYYRSNTRADNREARKLFEQAIALDPSYASAYVGLAMSRILTVSAGWTEQMVETLDEAERLARKALELDSSNAEAHAALADIYLVRAQYDNPAQYDLALAEADQAILLNPNDAWSYAGRGGILVFSGNAKEAVRSFEVATRLNPTLNVGRQYPFDWAYYLVGRYEDAVRLAEAGARKNPDDYFNHACLAASYAQLGRADKAAKAASATLHAWPFFHVETFGEQFRQAEDRSAVRQGLWKAGLR